MKGPRVVVEPDPGFHPSAECAAAVDAEPADAELEDAELADLEDDDIEDEPLNIEASIEAATMRKATRNMAVAMALISGGMPRWLAPQTNSGKVVTLPEPELKAVMM